MKTYWELTEPERALLTETELQSYCSIELMEKAIPEPPTTDTTSLPDTPELATETYYSVGSVLFKTQEQAIAFLKLNPSKSDYDYNIGYEYKYPTPVTDTVQPTICFIQSDLYAKRDTLVSISETKKSNSDLKDKYEKVCKEATTALSGLRNDWWNCRDKAQKFIKVINTRNDYIAMTNNDTEMATKFLDKTFGKDVVDEALEWYPIKTTEINDVS